MKAKTREERLRSAALALLGSERAIGACLGQCVQAMNSARKEAVAVADAQAVSKEHQEALESYIGSENSSDGVEAGDCGIPLPAVMNPAEIPGQNLPRLLHVAHDLLSSAALSYSALHEFAMRLFEPPLRQLAPRHLKDYTRAATRIGAFLPGAIARMLEQDGLGCHCICPMCGIGACGCVELATLSLWDSWSDAAAREASDGLLIGGPKSGSSLAEAGVQAAELLLEVDGKPVRAIPEIQAAIREHAIGEGLMVRVGTDTSDSREIPARHASDYPNP